LTHTLAKTFPILKLHGTICKLKMRLFSIKLPQKGYRQHFQALM
jgi:hypothetical protein